MNYTLHQLKIFLKVAEQQSITKAAAELYLTQPAISIQLKKLQDQFDLPLTEVVGRQLFITDFGQEILIRTKRILAESEAIKYTIDQYKGFLTGKIKISVVSTGKYVIPYFLRSFIDQHPGIEISIDVSNKNRVIEGLVKNESDFSLVSIVPNDLKVNKLELMENRLYLIGNADYTGQIKTKRDLEKVTLLFREDGSATKNAMLEFLEKNKISIKKSMQLVSNEAVKQAINAGLGFSIVPLIGLRTALKNENMKIFQLKGLPIITQWNLIYSKGKNLTPAQGALVDYIENNKAQLVEEHFNWAVHPEGYE